MRKGGTVAELEHRLRSNSAELSPAELRGSQTLLDNYEDLPFLTAEAVARLGKVSASTVVRLVSKLGYGSYMELQAEAQHALKQRLSSVERLRKIGRVDSSEPLGNKLASPSLEHDVRLLLELGEIVSLENVRNVAYRLSATRSILIVGYRASAPLAYYLHLSLTQLLGPKVRLASDAMLLPESIVALTKEDLLLAISFPRYSSVTIQAAEVAHKQGATVVAITNSILSPLGPFAQYILTCPFGGPTVQNSPVAYYALMHILIEQLVAVLGPSVHQEIERRLNETEELLAGWGWLVKPKE